MSAAGLAFHFILDKFPTGRIMPNDTVNSQPLDADTSRQDFVRVGSEPVIETMQVLWTILNELENFFLVHGLTSSRCSG